MDGIDNTPEGIAVVRNNLIQIRDEALKQNSFEWAVVLSHSIALLAELMEIKEISENPK